jgi:hypothetical protein
LAVALTACAAASHAAEIYGGIGLPGALLGYGGSFGASLGWRGEVAGGLKLKRDGRREGLEYSGELKTGRAAAFLDWYPLAGSFRLSAGLTANDIKVNLNGTGTTGTINGKAVSLVGETFRVTAKYAASTPYLGLGGGHQQADGGGIGFFWDLGAQFGSFDVSAQTSLVGKFGVTQADVDAEAKKVRDTLDSLKVIPMVAIGLTYRF